MYRITNLLNRDIGFKTFDLPKGETKFISDEDEQYCHSAITNCVKHNSISISKVSEPKIISEPIVIEKVRKTRKTKKGN